MELGTAPAPAEPLPESWEAYEIREIMAVRGRMSYTPISPLRMYGNKAVFRVKIKVQSSKIRPRNGLFCELWKWMLKILHSMQSKFKTFQNQNRKNGLLNFVNFTFFQSWGGNFEKKWNRYKVQSLISICKTHRYIITITRLHVVFTSRYALISCQKHHHHPNNSNRGWWWEESY